MANDEDDERDHRRAGEAYGYPVTGIPPASPTAARAAALAGRARRLTRQRAAEPPPRPPSTAEHAVPAGYVGDENSAVYAHDPASLAAMRAGRVAQVQGYSLDVLEALLVQAEAERDRAERERDAERARAEREKERDAQLLQQRRQMRTNITLNVISIVVPTITAIAALIAALSR